MNQLLQKRIPGQIGRYDDTFNANCVGDTFTSLGCPTVLFEAGQLALDYHRNNTRALLKEAFMALLLHVSGVKLLQESSVEEYLQIPGNDVFYDDLLIKAVKFSSYKEAINIRAHYKEVLSKSSIVFIPELVEYGKDVTGFAHQIVDTQNTHVDNSTTNHTDLASFIEEYLQKNFSR